MRAVKVKIDARGGGAANRRRQPLNVNDRSGGAQRPLVMRNQPLRVSKNGK